MIQLIPDSSVFIMMGVFILAFIVINFLIFQPLLKLMDLRASQTEDKVAESITLQEQGAQLKNQYEERISLAKHEGLAKKDQEKKAAQKEANELVEGARAEMEKKIQSARDQQKVEWEKAESVLSNITQDLSKSLAERLLGRTLNS